MDDGYDGPAELTIDGVTLRVRVTLRGAFEPVDGRYHWYGRIAAHEDLTALVGTRKPDAAVRTPSGEAVGVLSDPDTWNRYRITGTSRPPFEIPTSPADLPTGS